MSFESGQQDRWATRIGLVLAMAGNAVGLGNFLRFPVQAAQNGGGTFMIPYVIFFLVLGIPLMWIEWGIGRLGGRKGQGTVPAMFHLLANRATRWAKYLGVLGVIMPLVVFIYYTYLASWMLGFAFFSITGDYFGTGNVDEMRSYLASYQNIYDPSTHGGWVALVFFAFTIAFLGWVLARGISGGIERLALVGMPVLFLFAAILVVRVLTLPAAEGSVAEGLNFIWNPNWGDLANARVWLAAAGQMFFTLSVGMGSIHTYASYLSEKDDVTLTGLSTASTNEFAEVVLGGTIAIPAAVVFFGVAGATAIANGGAFDLGIVAMGVVFQGLPGAEIWGRVAGFLWFFLLFVAGITSCVAMASPAISFLQNAFRWTRRKAAYTITGLGLGLGLFHVVFYARGVLGEWDYWAGTFGLVIFATVEILLFSFVFGQDRMRFGERLFSLGSLEAGWRELHLGADLRIPGFYKPVMKWITPAVLVFLLVWWGWTQATPVLMMDGIEPGDVPWLWTSRLLMLALFGVGLVLIRIASTRGTLTPDEPASPGRP